MLGFETIGNATLILIRFRVGGKEMTIDLDVRSGLPGVTFEAPRGSLMTAVQYRAFDDLMIANFMRTTLHGEKSRTYLNKTFTRAVCKYADNGKAESKEEVRRYFSHYESKDRLAALFFRLETGTADVFRRLVRHDSMMHKAAKKLYWTVRG